MFNVFNFKYSEYNTQKKAYFRKQVFHLEPPILANLQKQVFCLFFVKTGNLAYNLKIHLARYQKPGEN